MREIDIEEIQVETQGSINALDLAPLQHQSLHKTKNEFFFIWKPIVSSSSFYVFSEREKLSFLRKIEREIKALSGIYNKEDLRNQIRQRLLWMQHQGLSHRKQKNKK